MKPSVGPIDRIARVIVGPVLPSMLPWASGNAKRFGLIGIAPIVTAVLRWCPAHPPFGIDIGAK